MNRATETSDERFPSTAADREGSAPVRGYASARPPIDGIVLAAGRSRRIGRSKPLLRLRAATERRGRAPAEGPGQGGLRRAAGREEGGAEGATFLERAAACLTAGGCRSVIVVAAARDDPVHRVARALDAVVVQNPDPDSQPIDSVRLAIASLPPDSAAVLVLPVDVPLVATTTVAAVVDAFVARRAPIVAPSHGGVLGHPVLIARPLFESVLMEPLDQGLRSLLERHRDEIDAVHVDDPGTLVDIDTAADYDKHVIRGDPRDEVSR